MPTAGGPNTLGESNLVFAYDTGDVVNSYKGEPTVNLISSANINGYPTYGNSWGTYNTNRYYPFFSIGTVSSVSNNIVTTAGSHTMRSFDVLRPETNGGGVSTGTNYLVKKISDTQFSLHAYNGSQDGSQGYINPTTGQFKVHDSYWLDERVSINASSFPTSWVGEAHLPNSALVKEIIPGGFPIVGGRGTDCIRAHWFRTDGVTDGMAYGGDASVTPGVPVYLSCWLKAVDTNAVGKSLDFYHYTYGVTGPTAYAVTCTLGPVGVWQRFGYTFTTPNSVVISYWFPHSANMKVDIANIQIEQKNHATPFTAGTRSATQGLLPVIGNSTIDLSNVSFDSSAKMVFDGTDDYIELATNIQSGFTQASYEFICTPTSLPGGSSYRQLYIQENSTWMALYNYGGVTFFGIDLNNGSGWFDNNGGYNTGARTTATITANTTYHVFYSWNGTSVSIYLNGNLQSTTSTLQASNGRQNVTTLGAGTTPRNIGSRGSGTFWAGNIDIVKFYNRALTAQEIQQNYQQYKTRFNLS